MTHPIKFLIIGRPEAPAYSWWTLPHVPRVGLTQYVETYHLDRMRGWCDPATKIRTRTVQEIAVREDA